MTDQRKRLGVFISFSGDGGVERMITNLCAEFAHHVHVDLLALKLGGGHASRIADTVNVIELRARHAWTAVGEVTPPMPILPAQRVPTLL